MIPVRRTAAFAAAVLLSSCLPAGGSTPVPAPPSPTSTATGATVSASPSPTPSPSRSTPSPSRDATRTATPEPTPSLPEDFPIRGSLLDGGAAVVVKQLHEVSGLRPALKLDVSEEEVTLTVLSIDLQAQSYRWRDGIIEQAETDVQYLKQTIFWPTDFALDDVRLIFDNASLLGTSSNGQLLQVVEYSPGEVFMSVTTRPETSTVFFRKDGTVFRSLGVSSVADIREGIEAVVDGASQVYVIGFGAQAGYFAELPGPDGYIERHSRMANRPMFASQRTGATPLVPFDPSLLDPAAIAQTIAAHDSGKGCDVEVDNRFERVQPVITYTCDEQVFHSDLQGRDMTAQLR